MPNEAYRKAVTRARLTVTGNEIENVYYRNLNALCHNLSKARSPEAVEQCLRKQEAALREAFALVRERYGIDRRRSAA